MRKKLPKILVTGGAGFIGSAFVRQLVKRGLSPKALLPEGQKGVPEIVIIDKLTYAGDLKRLSGINIYKRGLSPKALLPEGQKGVPFYRADICNKKHIEQIFVKEKPDIVVHFAAESHVDRSINDATPFIETNVKGTQILADASRKYNISRFIFLSTDEVYGEIAKGKFSEDSPIRPNSPYAASKAAADLLVQSYIRTYKFPAIIIRPSNNYGPWQYPEKLIPLAILRILEGGKIPVYGKGKNVREWLYVDDCAKGIKAVMEKGKIGHIYNLGSNQESKNIDTIKLLLKILGVKQDRFEFVKDRLGHDLRYSLDCEKVHEKISWRPDIELEQGLTFTVAWARKNQGWLRRMKL